MPMNELELLIEENNKLKAVLADFQKNIAEAEKGLEEMKAELAEDVEEQAAYHAYLTLSQCGINQPFIARESDIPGDNTLDTSLPRERVIEQHANAYKEQFHKGLKLK
jgi:hypothetical protein